MGFPSWSVVKILPTMQEARVRSLGQEDPLEKEMATHSNILAWIASCPRIPWTEEPDRLQPMGSQRVGHDWVTNPFIFHMCVCVYIYIYIYIVCVCQIFSKISVDYKCQTLDHNNFRILLWNPETKGNKQEKIKNDPQAYKLIKIVAQKKKKRGKKWMLHFRFPGQIPIFPRPQELLQKGTRTRGKERPLSQVSCPPTPKSSPHPKPGQGVILSGNSFLHSCFSSQLFLL